MTSKKKTLIVLGVVSLLIASISIIAYFISNNTFDETAYQTGQGLTDKQKKANLNDLIKKKNYDGAKILADNYYYYDNNLENYSKYLLGIQICKEENLDSLDKADSIKGTSVNSVSKTNTVDDSTVKDNEKQKLNKLTDNMNSIGIDNLTQEQTISFINEYMTFWNKNTKYQNDFYDEVVGNLVKLKRRYYTFNKYYIDSRMMVSEAKIGMTKAEVIAFTKYIQPQDINKTTTKYYTKEQYCYRDYEYLYFEDGILTCIQE